MIVFRYLYVRLDGSMTIKKRAKVVEQFNNPSVSTCVPRPLIMSIIHYHLTFFVEMISNGRFDLILTEQDFSIKVGNKIPVLCILEIRTDIFLKIII